MDDGKLKKLRELGYVVRRCCGNCVHWVTVPKDMWWSTCQVNTYDHQKHNDSVRLVSVTFCGHCSKHKFHSRWGRTIHGYSEFVEEDDDG